MRIMISAALRGRRFMNSFLGPKMFVSNDSGRDKRDVRRAKKLAAAIVAKSRLTQRKPDIAKWSAEFRDLRLVLPSCRRRWNTGRAQRERIP
jgi:hypothetical protein